MSAATTEAMELLAREICQVGSCRAGRLAAVRVGAPARWVPGVLGRQLADELHRLGLAGVEVVVDPVEGPLRILALEFTR